MEIFLDSRNYEKYIKTVHTKQFKFNNKHSVTYHNIETGGKLILKRHDKETKLQSEY